MEQLLEWMEIIEDIRQPRKVRHCIKDILVIVLFATLANADTWEQIADFALWNEDYLRQYIELKNGIPSHDTIQRVMGMIRRKISSSFRENGRNCWTVMKVKSSRRSSAWTERPCVPIKGKEQSHAISFQHGAGRTDTVWGRKQRMKKSNEITAIPKVLESIEIKGQIVTIDAMGTQTSIVETIRKRHADYVLAVKGNQGKLEENSNCSAEQ